MDFPASVAPFILRGVKLMGIDSVMCLIEKRRTAWHSLARDLDRSKLTELTRRISLGDVPEQAAKLMAGER
jgi:acrylyl-CoA reductase (NADPH)